MFFINIDENRKQTGWSEISENAEIQVDCLAPAQNYKLKENYQEFSGEQQWEEIPVALEELKQQKITEVENAYKNSFLNGLDTSINIKFHIKPDDQLNYIGAMIATASFQDTDILQFPLIDFYGTNHQITVAQLKQAYLEIVNYKAQVELQRATLFAQINSSESSDDLPVIAEVLSST